MLRRRSTRAALPAVLLTALAALAGVLGAATPASAAALSAIDGRPSLGRTCAEVVAAAGQGVPDVVPAEGWERWWPTSALDDARLAGACRDAGRAVPEPRWRAQVALRLSASFDSHPELGRWLLTTAAPPARVPNPIAALVDEATAGARRAAPTCSAAPAQVLALAWLANPDVVDGTWPLADDGSSPFGDAPGLSALLVQVTPPPPPVVVPAEAVGTTTAPPVLRPTLAAVAAWLCARPDDLATPAGQEAAFTALLVDPLSVGQAVTVATRFGPGPLDPHVVIPRAAGRSKLTAVGPFRVATSVAPGLTQLLADAAADGVVLTGGAYRSESDQVERRRANCAGPDGVADDYDLYEKPSDQCSPRTARPGLSLHETGEAVDFERCQTHDTACWRWLARYAHRYGLVNLPEEPWHWSVNGQ